MSLRKETPCDCGPCPYDAEYYRDCEWYCGEEPIDESEYDQDEEWE